MPIAEDGVTVLCPACWKRSLDHDREQQHQCFITIPETIENLLKKRALVCEVGDDMHDAQLMASDGGLYCFVHQPPHTGVVVPRSAMPSYVVYDKPFDYPNGYVVRRFINQAAQAIPTGEVYTADTDEILDGIREEFRRCGLTVIPRMPRDHPSVVEVWM